MSATLHLFPTSEESIQLAWSAFDDARLKLEALYADPGTTREERLHQCQVVARRWQRWQNLFLGATN